MIRGRQQVIGPGKDEVQAQCIQAVEAIFHENWLSQEDGHPLQELWRRPDGLASCELVLFGECLSQISSIAPEWLKRQVTQIKLGDPNNRRGAFAEIFCVRMFADGKQIVTPAKESQPGYDLTIDMPTGQRVYGSVKSFGLSHRETEFRRECTELEQVFKNALATIHRTGLGVLLNISEYPSASHWKHLRQFVRDHVIALCSEVGTRKKIGKWTIEPFVMTSLPLSRNGDWISYQLLVIAPYHQNERQNLYTKLDSAWNQMQRLAIEDEALRAIFIQMPQTSDLRYYSEWSKSYVDINKGKIDLVVLYRISADDTSRLNHHHLQHCSERAISKLVSGTTGARLAGCIFLGAVSNVPPVERVRAGPFDVPLQGNYVYQSGHMFPMYTHDPAERTTITLTTPHKGLHQHGVISIDGQELLMRGLFSSDGFLKLVG